MKRVELPNGQCYTDEKLGLIGLIKQWIRNKGKEALEWDEEQTELLKKHKEDKERQENEGFNGEE